MTPVSQRRESGERGSVPSKALFCRPAYLWEFESICSIQAKSRADRCLSPKPEAVQRLLSLHRLDKPPTCAWDRQFHPTAFTHRMVPFILFTTLLAAGN